MSCHAEFENARGIGNFSNSDKIRTRLEELTKVGDPGLSPSSSDNTHKILEIGIELRELLIEKMKHDKVLEAADEIRS